MRSAGARQVRICEGVGRGRPVLWVWRSLSVRESPEKRLVEPAPSSGEDEAAWVARTLRGDEDAFGRLVDAYSSRVFTHLCRLVGNREEAEDLAQETFVRAYRFLERYDRRRPLRNWLYTIATRVGLNALRSRRRRPSVAMDGAAEPVDPREDGRQHAARRELEERVTEMMGRLPERSALLVHLHYREGLSVAEAAEAAGMTEGAAKVALHRARRSLREWFAEEPEE